MSKRSTEDLENYMERKIRRIEKKFKKKLQKHSSILTEQSENVAISTAQESEVTEQSPSVTSEVVEDPEILGLDPTVECDPGTETSTCVNPEEESLPAEILEILGEAPLLEIKFGKKLHNDIALRWAYTATNGLSKEQRKEILNRHLIPENSKNIDAPLLNAEVKAALSDILNKKDKAIEQKQKQIALIISCIGEALTSMLNNKNSDVSIVKSLTDAGKLTCDLQHTESMLRRGYVCSYIKKDIKDQLYNTKIDDHLFGDKLAETLKAAKAINKSGAEIKNQPQMQNTQRNNKNLNWKPPPPPLARQAGVTTRRLPATAATPTSMATRYQQRRPAQPVPPPMRAYSQRSRTQTQPRK